jgi:tetratricopeptide (TPR) repeat protein
MCTFRRILPVSVFAVILLTSVPSRAKVQAWEGTLTIPTYGWSDDVNPKFWALEDQIKLSTTVKGAIVYPYTMQDHLSRTKADRTYKALFLENEYLKVTCLPELGGRLHSVLDKTTGEETFHCNHVIKPSMIAMRGAFISGGVEWNAGPQVHTVTIVSPVDALVGTSADGSAYLEVSNLEQTLRTRWTVRVTLHPGRAYLDEQIRIFNPVDAVNPYYFWNCTAFPCRAGTRFIYPMTLGTDHYGVKFFSWPVHEGRDLSWLKNYATSSSIFAVDCVFDFFGAYDVDADRGVVQVANHYELSGKKAWTWGTWDFGLVCQKNLTDDDGPYIEVQSGPLPTQSDYGMMLPRQEVAWREWWYPVHGLGDGFEFATKDLAVQTTRQDGQLDLRLLATGRFPGASCSVSQQKTELVTKRLDLSPAGPQTVTVSPNPDAPVDVVVKTRRGEVLASFTTPLPIPKTKPPQRPDFMDKPEAQLTVEEKYLKAQKFDLATNRKRARESYEKVLADDPGYVPALRALAILDTEAGRYADAIPRLQKAAERDPGDGLAWYFLGVDYLKTGDANEALRCARQAKRRTGTGALAFDLAGRAHAALKEYPAALEAFQKAVRLNPQDAKARDHLLLATYAAGDPRSALQYARRAVAQHPTDLVPRALLALQGRKEMEGFVRQARDFVGEDDFEMLETGLVFAEIGLAEEAAKLLDAVCIDAVPEKQRSPLPMYYLAWLASLQDDPKTARLWLGRAAATYRDYVFASRPEELEVLGYALRENPDDAYAHFHVGNLYAHLGRLAEAIGHWQKAVERDKSLSVAHRNLGLYAWAVDEDLVKAEQSYRNAIAARPEDQTLYRDLAEILIGQGQRPEAIKLLVTMPSDGLRRADVLIMLAQAYLEEQQYTEAIDLLESTPYFVNWEGQSITWDLFHRAHMKRGRDRFEDKDFAGALKDFEAALTYPGNIGVGRSNRPQEAAAQYWRGRALLALGRLEEARSAWKEGAAGPEGRGEQNKYRQLCRDALHENQT